MSSVPYWGYRASSILQFSDIIHIHSPSQPILQGVLYYHESIGLNLDVVRFVFGENEATARLAGLRAPIQTHSKLEAVKI